MPTFNVTAWCTVLLTRLHYFSLARPSKINLDVAERTRGYLQYLYAIDPRRHALPAKTTKISHFESETNREPGNSITQIRSLALGSIPTLWEQLRASRCSSRQGVDRART